MPRLRNLWFDLPPQLEDVSESFFTSKEGPVLVLPIVYMPELATKVEPWLHAAREQAKLLPGGKLGQVTTYENPRYLVRGFEADFGSSIAVTAIVSQGSDAWQITTKCRPGYEPVLAQIFASLRPEAEAEAPRALGLHSYSAAGLRFESTQVLEEPAFLSLRSRRGSIRILGEASAKRLKRTRPDWGSHFGLGAGDEVTELLQGRRTIVGERSLASDEAPEFQSRYWLASVSDGETQRELGFACAVCASEPCFFRFIIKAEGADALEQLEVLTALLSSARRMQHGG